MVIDYKKEGRIAIFTINRPEVLNALNKQVERELNEAVLDFRDDPEVWVGIITGAGERAFSSGHDINEEREAYPMAAEGCLVPAEHQVWKPFIAAICGYCLGGGLEIALSCDIRIAAENSVFGLPEINIGGLALGGGTQRLPRMIPWCKAAEILLMGQHIDAQEAYRIGLVNKVVPIEQLMPVAKQWAEILCQAAPLSVRATKEAMIRGYSMSLNGGLQLARELASSLTNTEDSKEGVTAFKEKRKPRWKGK